MSGRRIAKTSLHPDDRAVTDEATAACQRAIGFLELGMPVDALAELDELRGNDAESSLTLHLRVDALFRLQEWSAAAEICLPMLEKEPADPAWWIQAAYAQRRAGSIDEAELILRSALQGHPKHALILYNLACYSCVQGNREEARTLLDQSFAEDPEAMLVMATGDPDLAGIRPWILEQLKKRSASR